MPFGGYKDFDDCVAKNSDKGDPQAYCGTIKDRAENSQPSGDGLFKVDLSTFREGDKVRTLEIFRAGKHTDSQGREKEWTSNDLQQIIDAFKAQVPGRVPIKVGHTSDEFNQKISDALGIPSDLLLGEGPHADGAASFGSITDLRLNGQILEASMEVNPALDDLINKGLFTDVSSEIFHSWTDGNGKSWGPVLSAVAILGANRPAVSGLKNFTQRKVGDNTLTPDSVLMFSMQSSNFDEDEAKSTLQRVLGRIPTASEIKDFLSGKTAQQIKDAVSRSDNSQGVRVAAGALPISDEAIDSAFALIDAAIKDTLLSGTVQRTGMGNTIRQAYKTVKGTLHRAFSEAAQTTPSPIVVALSFPHTNIDDAKQYINHHSYLLDQGPWEYEEQNGKVRAASRHAKIERKPSHAQSSTIASHAASPRVQGSRLIYRFQDMGDGIRAVVAEEAQNTVLDDNILDPNTRPYLQSTVDNQGDLDMTKEKEIRDALGIGENEDILAAVSALKQSSTDIANLKERMDAADHKERVLHYRESVADLLTIPGTPDELAENLASIHEKHGEDEAKRVLSGYQATHSAAERAGVLSTLSQQRIEEQANNSEVESKLKQIMDEQKVERNQALAIFAQKEPAAFAQYWNEQREAQGRDPIGVRRG